MTSDNLATVGPGVSQEEARRLLHQRRIEKLLVVDDDDRCVGLITVKDIEKAVAYPDATKDGAGRLRVAAATTVGDKGFERSAGADRRRMRPASSSTPRTATIVEVAAAVERIRKHLQRGPDRRRQRRHRRGDQGADRRRRGRGEGRHRPGLDLHHPGRRRGRRAAAHRDHGCGRGSGEDRHAGDRRRRPPDQRRRRQGARRGRLGGDDRLAARRHRGGAGRDLPLPGPRLQILSRHGLGRGDGARLGRPLFPAGHQGPAQAGARGDRGPGALQGPCRAT